MSSSDSDSDYDSNDLCLGMGMCLTWTNGEYISSYPCKHRCSIVKCPNFLVCGNRRPQWLLGTYKNKCYHCFVQLIDAKVVTIPKNTCSGCQKSNTLFIEYTRCKHLLCVSCVSFNHNLLTNDTCQPSKNDFKISCLSCANNALSKVKLMPTRDSLDIWFNRQNQQSPPSTPSKSCLNK